MPISPELLLSLSPKALRSLLSTFGPLPSLRPTATPFAIARAIFSASSSPAKLAHVLSSTVARFSTRSGRLAVVEAARASGDRRAEEWLAEPAGDVAVNLAVERATAKGRARRLATRLFALAGHRVDRNLSELPTYELVAAEPVDRDPKRVVARLRRTFGDRLLEAWDAVDADGALRLALFLEQPTEIRLVRDEGSRGVAQRRDVPVAVDTVRIFPDGRRVAFTTAMPERLTPYASALSLSLQPSFTLRTLLDLTSARLAALAIPRVTKVAVVALRFRRPDGTRIEIRADDALDPSLHPPRAGYIDRATIRVTIDGTRTVDAFLQLPHRIEISDPALMDPVRAVLDALGIFAPGALPDDARSLAPYVHGDWRWCAVMSRADFDSLVSRGRLVRVASSHVATEEHRMHGAAYVVRDVPGERDVQYALAEDRSLGARLVGPEDRVAWRLDRDALAESMRCDLGAVAPDAPLGIAGMLDLGVVTLASGKLRFVYAMAAPPAGWVEAVRRACGVGVTAVVMVPRGHAGKAPGLLEIEIDVGEQLGVKRIGRVLGRAAEALRVAGEVEKWRLCDEEVVVEPATQSVWVTGVRVLLTERAYGLVLVLAQNGSGVVATKDVGMRLSSHAGAPDVTARKAKGEAERQVREALEGAGVDAGIVERMIIAEGKKGYRFGVGVRVA